MYFLIGGIKVWVFLRTILCAPSLLILDDKWMGFKRMLLYKLEPYSYITTAPVDRFQCDKFPSLKTMTKLETYYYICTMHELT